MADGKEQREEEQKRREQETWREREDRLDRTRYDDPYQPERDES